MLIPYVESEDVRQANTTVNAFSVLVFEMYEWPSVEVDTVESTKFA